jgi:hypothetical protein
MPTRYRYMALATPTNIKAISNQVSPSVGQISITTPPPTMIDVELENTSADDKEDLDSYMESIGYVYMATDPPALTNGETVVWENGAWTCVHLGPETSLDALETTSNASSFKEKLPHGFVSPSATAKHFILYDVTYETTSVGCRVRIELVLDGGQVLAWIEDKPGGSGSQRKFSGHIEGAAYGAGAHTLSLQYKRLGGGGSIKLRDAKITTRRAL